MTSLPTSTRSHPLELIPLFRRWPRTPLRNLLYTGIWSSMIGSALAVTQTMFTSQADLLDYLGPMLLVSNIVGYLIHGGLQLPALLLRDWPSRQGSVVRSLYYVGVVMVLVVAGITVGNRLLPGTAPYDLARPGTLTPLLPFGLEIAVLMFAIRSFSERRVRAELAAMRQREEIAAAAQLLAEARLKALQAQIEPHFLYNTLAGVVSLIDSQPAKARHMLERFIDFLRASLAASRAETTTVAGELALAQAYLDVLAVRMGARLHFSVEAGGAAGHATIAPMLIQPLVENAVMHGLEPKVEGGSVHISARIDGAMLLIDVADDGVGIGNAPPRSGGGVGLTNLKARLRSLYGPGARLELLDQPGGGACARLLLPSTFFTAPHD